MYKLPELLAPAGTLEVLKAAVDAGADAVYFGGKAFNARAGAGNFSLEEIREGAEYAALRGVKTYLTLNTLVKNEQMEELKTFVSQVIRCGISGMIITDLGVARMIHENYPHFPLHGSTQMNIHDLEGARYLKSLGYERVVLARELSADQIRRISEQAGLETETFIHGALCYSYSGRCLFSSYIGGRSGNRGRCAQSCRLPYTPEGSKQEEFCMNLKDMCTIRHIKELVETGTSSLKIEGRLKSAAYVAGVVRLYRKALDHYAKTGENYPITGTEMKELELLFNRGGFSSGYLFGKSADMVFPGSPKHSGIEAGFVSSIIGSTMTLTLNKQKDLPFSPGDTLEIVLKEPPYPSLILRKEDIVKENEQELMLRVRRMDKVQKEAKVNWLISRNLTDSILKECSGKKIPVRVKAFFFVGRKPLLEVSSELEGEQVKVTLEGEQVISEAQSRPMGKADLEKQLSKTGGTDFELSELQVQCGEDLFLPVSMINSLRRSALDSLQQALLQCFQKHVEQRGACVGGLTEEVPAKRDTAFSSPTKRKDGELTKEKSRYSVDPSAEFAAIVTSLPQAESLKDTADVLYLRSEFFRPEDLEKLQNGSARIGLALPLISREEKQLPASQWKQELKNWQEAGIREIYVHHLGQLALGKALGFTVWCSPDIGVMNDETLHFLQQESDGVMLSSELTLSEWQAFSSRHPEKTGALVYGHVPAMVTEQRVVEDRAQAIYDRKKERWMVEKMPDDYRVIYTPQPVNALILSDKLKKCPLGRWVFRFVQESPQECLTLLNAGRKVQQESKNRQERLFEDGVEVYWLRKAVE